MRKGKGEQEKEGDGAQRIKNWRKREDDKGSKEEEREDKK